MKQKGKYSTLKFTFLIAVFLMTISASTVAFGGVKDNAAKDSAAKANIMKTMTMGMKSQNHGLATSTIYLVGYYGFLWAIDPLVEVLNDPSRETIFRVFAAYSLYMINEEKGMEAVKTVSVYEKDYMLQRTCEFLYNDYVNRKTEIFSSSK